MKKNPLFIDRACRELSAIVLYEMAKYPELKVASKPGEGPGPVWGALLCGNYRFHMRIKKEGWFKDYSLWVESHTLNHDATYTQSGSIYVFETNYQELTQSLHKRCEEWSRIQYHIIDEFIRK